MAAVGSLPNGYTRVSGWNVATQVHEKGYAEAHGAIGITTGEVRLWSNGALETINGPETDTVRVPAAVMRELRGILLAAAKVCAGVKP